MKRSVIWLFVLVMVAVAAFITGSEKDKIDHNLQLFSSFFRTLNDHYVDTVDAEKLMRSAIDATVKSLDPYTRFYNEEETKKRKEVWKGELYAGIGATVNQRGNMVMIMEPREGYPAWQAGLRSGDVLIKADTSDLTGKTLREVVELLRGEPGTTVDVTVMRPGTGSIKKTLTRQTIKSKAIPFYGMIDQHTGYIKLAHFLKGASGSLTEALQALKGNPGFEALVIDLQGNTGGVAEEAVASLNLFFPKGTTICTLKGKNARANYSYITENEPLDTLIPLVLLTSSKTISAGEIFAGTIQDYDRAVIIGQKTFGKGYVQGTRSSGFGTSLYVTTARYYTPSGRCLQKMDYSEYSSGTVKPVSDSLKKEFHTRNGRIVYNIGGVEPDVKMEMEEEGELARSLVKSWLLFDFANEYRNKTPLVASAAEFKLTDDEYSQFVKYATTRLDSFLTPAEKQLVAFREKAESEKTWESLQKDYSRLQQNLAAMKVRQLTLEKPEIKAILEKEIIRKYYADSGLYRLFIAQSKSVAEAREILGDEARYMKILAIR